MEAWYASIAQSALSLHLGLFVLLVVEEAGVPFPLPGYAVMAFLGFQARQTDSLPFSLLLVAIVAVTLGSCILYGVAYSIGRPLLERLGRFGRSQVKRVDKIEKWFERRGIPVVVVGRLVPNLRNPTSLAAGFIRLPAREFVPGTFVAASIWSIGYFYLGFFFGRSIANIGGLFGG
jgi:membrane protein DedA with SNARE-associated domain